MTLAIYVNTVHNVFVNSVGADTTEVKYYRVAVVSLGLLCAVLLVVIIRMGQANHRLTSKNTELTSEKRKLTSENRELKEKLKNAFCEYSSMSN